jgi:transposase InsO family protein
VEVIAAFSEEERANSLKEFNGQDGYSLPVTKALGMAWDGEKDCLTFSTRREVEEVRTPAEVLSHLASVYDPIGIVGPFTLKGKLIMQAIWSVKPEWKAKLTGEQSKTFLEWTEGIQHVAELWIPRWFGLDKKVPSTLHVFADASNVGYGTVTYLTQPGKETAFVSSKSRIVNPKRQETIPRLELQGLTMGFRLSDTLLQELGGAMVINRVVFWSDSVIVLYWIKNDETRYKPYVANRLREIHEFLQSANIKDLQVEIRHVPTDLNPADLVSRGCEAEEFVNRFQFWSQGPGFLTQEESEWPVNLVASGPEKDIEEKKPKGLDLAMVGTENALPEEDQCQPLDEENSLMKYLHRRLGEEWVTTEKVTEEELSCIKQAQKLAFPAELKACKKQGNKSIIPRMGSLQKKQILLDGQGILRLVTRLTNADFMSEEEKQPIILPRQSAFTRLVVRSAHEEVGHLGRQSTMAELRRRFFIAKMDSLVRHELYKCKKCREIRPIQVTAPLAPLHDSRLKVGSHAFAECGMDHFGPIHLAKKQKKWGLIFMCLTTRAIHLEDCHSTDYESLLMAMERFIQRRGKPDRIRSDRGTSFIRAANEQGKTADALAEENTAAVGRKWQIDFAYNPARTPHWGGSWERMIQEVKKILITGCESVGRLSAEAFRTALVEAEGILNRRPLDMDEDGHAICPNDIVAPAAKENGGFPLGSSTIKMVRRVQMVINHFWINFQKFYLSNYSVNKVTGKANCGIPLETGDPVIIKEGSNPLVDKWVVGRILEIKKSQDGITRSAMVEIEGEMVLKDIRRIAIVEGPALSRQRKTPEMSFSRGVSAPDQQSVGETLKQKR